MVTASLIVGVSAFMCLILAFVVGDGNLVLSFLLGIIGIPLGVVATRRYKKSTGLIMAIITVVLDIVLLIIAVFMISKNRAWY